jgi:hypothetical protein
MEIWKYQKFKVKDLSLHMRAEGVYPHKDILEKTKFH